MIPAARLSAAIEVLDAILSGAGAEAALTAWGRANRFAGSGDRFAIRDLVFDALRCKRSFAALGGGMTGRGLILGQVRATGGDEAALFCGQGHAPSAIGPADHWREPTPAETLDAPDWLIDLGRQRFGTGFDQIWAAQKTRAPVFLRSNPKRASRAQVQASLAQEAIESNLIQSMNYALEVTKNERKIKNSVAFQTGMIELQDAASQCVIETIDLPKTGKILDLCAGGGGKTLSIAAQLSDNDRVILFAHDENPRRMADLPLRSARAGARIEILENINKSERYDLILTDVPCSGSGSWRRDPQGKWALTPDRLAQLVQTQAQILSDATEILAVGGRLVYVTCSVLPQENEDQVAAFLRRHPRFRLLSAQRFGLGQQGALAAMGDGFFAAQFAAI